MFTRLSEVPQIKAVADIPASEGFLDLIRGVFNDVERRKKSDPASWRRAFTTTGRLIGILRKTYGEPKWLEARGVIASPTVNMSDQASYLLVNNEPPEDLALALQKHVFTTQTILRHWTEATRERCEVLNRALQLVRFNPENLGAWPYYSNKLLQILYGLKPLNLIKAYHEFDGLMGSVVVMPDGELKIGSHKTFPQPFPTLTLEQIPAVVESLIQALTYCAEFPNLISAPSILRRKIAIPTGRVDPNGRPIYDYVCFLEYIQKHNEVLFRLVAGDYLASEAFDEDEIETYDDVTWISASDYKDTSQPYRELAKAMDRVCLAVEYWLYRSVR